jgi:hypothetical protein
LTTMRLPFRVTRRLHVAAAVMALLSVAGASARSQELASGITALEQRVVSERKRLFSGHVLLASKMKSTRVGDYERKAELWFQHDKARRDDWIGPERRETVFTKDALFFWDGTQSAWSTDLKDEKLVRRQSVPDPRLLGMAPTSERGLARLKLTSFVGHEPRSQLQQSEAPHEGRLCDVISYRIPPDILVTLWFSRESDQAAPVKVESKATVQGITLYEFVEVGLAYLDRGKVWYPKVCAYRRFENDILVKEERVDVLDAEFNVDLDPKTFAHESLGLPPGTTVYTAERPDVRQEAKREKWDGEKFIRIAGSNPGSRASGADVNRRRENWPLFASGILLGLAGLVMARKYFTKAR